jgi:transposase
MLDFAKELGNISEACRRLGISRQHFYDIKSIVEEEGIEGLLSKSRHGHRLGNRVSEVVEKQILEYAIENPTQGQVRVANELRKKGIDISPGGVRSIWLRNGLQTKKQRLGRLEK